MAWPQAQDYNEAIQNPQSSFGDPELRGGQAVTNALGLPMPRSGNFADVYEFQGASGQKWAIKCFTRQIPGLQERYSEISKHLVQAKLPFMVDFTYMAQGMRIKGECFPVLKMQWVEGFLLNEFVRANLDKPARLDALGQIWVRMAKRLREANIAHADLQHGNVILVPGRKESSLAVKLIDYDGMWVPALAQMKSGELGHPAYQHPRRLQEGIYSPDVDKIPLLAIACALRGLAVGGKPLWDKYDNGDNMLFREADLRKPTESELFKELWQLNDQATRDLTGTLAVSLSTGLEQGPFLADLMNNNQVLPLFVAQERPSGASKRAATKPKVNIAVPVAPVAFPSTRAWDFSSDGTEANALRRQAVGRKVSKMWMGLATVIGIVAVVGGIVWTLPRPNSAAVEVAKWDTPEPDTPLKKPEAAPIASTKVDQPAEKKTEPELSETEKSPAQPAKFPESTEIKGVPDKSPEPPPQTAINDLEKKANDAVDAEPLKVPIRNSKHPLSATALYKFDEGMGTSALNAVDGAVDGTHNAAYTSERPADKIPLTGEANEFGLSFSGKEAVSFTTPFIFHQSGDGTLEFWLKVPVRPPNCSIFWSSTGNEDTNRFNISLSSGYLYCDYRDPSGKLHTILPVNKVKILEKTWTHIAMARKGNKYEFFKDGKLVYWDKDESPSLPTSVGWKIGEREPGHRRFEGWIDEVQVSNKALLPREFLNALPGNQAKTEITLALLKSKLKGQIAYDNKNAVLTLAYDFTSKTQLDDFDVDTDKCSLTPGALNIQPQGLAKHKVKFTEVAVGGIVFVKAMRGAMVHTTGDTSARLGGNNQDTMYLNHPQAKSEFIVPAKERTGNIPFAVQIQPTRIAFAYGIRSLSLDVKEARAGFIEFSGGEAGFSYGQLVLSGKMDADWAKDFFAPPAAKTPADKGAAAVK